MSNHGSMCFSGDIVGQNQLCMTYNSVNKKKQYRECLCEKSDMSNHKVQCEPITKDIINRLKEHNKPLSTEYSRYSGLKSAFEGVPISADIVDHIVPADVLHTFGNGISAYLIQVNTGIVESKNRKNEKDEKSSYDALHQRLAFVSKKQSYRGMPRNSCRNGITDHTKMTGTERRGNLLLVLFSYYTREGRRILLSRPEMDETTLDGMKHTLKLFLAYEYFIFHPMKRDKMDELQRVVGKLIKWIKKYFPRNEGDGWNVPKMHALLRLPLNVQEFGCAENFFGGTGETTLQTSLKKPGANTQKRMDCFALQVATRIFETLCINKANEVVNGKNNNCWGAPNINDLFQDDDVDDEETLCFSSDKFQLKIGKSEDGRRKYSVDWKTKAKNLIHLDVDKTLVAVLSNYATSVGVDSKIWLQGNTTTKLNGELFRATPLFRESPWYDWCIVQFHGRTTDSIKLCAAKILGFFKGPREGGFPTPGLLEGMSGYGKRARILEIREKWLKDDQVYAVVHCCKEEFHYDQLVKKFVMEVNLGSDIGTYCEIVDVKTIHSTAYVFPDVGGNDARKHFLVLPRERWGEHFSFHFNC